VRARCLFLELERGDVDLKVLSRLQAEMEGLSSGFAAWVRWLAVRLAAVRQGVRERTAELRGRYPGPHGRTTDALARLHAVWEALRTYWLEVEVLDEEEAHRLSLEVEAALRTVGETQGAYQRDTDPVERFLPLLMAALSSGRVHLGNRHSAAEPPTDPERWGWAWRAAEGGWTPQGAQIGWVDEAGVYLEPTAAYAALNRLAAEGGSPCPPLAPCGSGWENRGSSAARLEGAGCATGLECALGGCPGM
jgi:hypothetical protein